jgi:hypothetical protein
MASADEKPWSVDTSSRGYALEIRLLKRVYVLPWTQFLYAEGTSEEVQAFFSMHDVVVRGTALSSLLADFASQQITVLKEPARTEKFSESTAGPRIFEVQVSRVNAADSE